MKIYTEDQLIEAIKMARSSSNIFATPFLHEQYEILDLLKPIELPSDDEIEDAWYEALHSLPSEQIGFILGAEWVINQIKQQSK